jgi:hypothetical protein
VGFANLACLFFVRYDSQSVDSVPLFLNGRSDKFGVLRYAGFLTLGQGTL